MSGIDGQWHSLRGPDAQNEPVPTHASVGWIGGYHLLHKIGAGGAGTVWEAVDDGGRRVALKMLHPSLAETDEARKRLLREARLVNQIDSPGVAAVIDVEADASTPFVVTELIAGQTLDAVVKNNALSAQELADLAIDLADILDSVHAAGVAHRDLKPSNIVMAPQGPVLIDFGIAQSVDDRRLTAPGSVAGTPGYVAPEILREGDDVTAQLWRDGDWFAWAAVLLSAATGRPPFGSGAPDAVLHRLFSGSPDTRGLSPTVARAFHLALSAEPTLRGDPDTLIHTLEQEDLSFLGQPTEHLPDASEVPFDFHATRISNASARSSLPDSAAGGTGYGGRELWNPDEGYPPTASFADVPWQDQEGFAFQQPDFNALFPPDSYVYRFPHARTAWILSTLLLALVGWLPATLGLGWAVAAPAVLFGAQVAGRAEHSLAARRERFGSPRASDGAVTAFSLPWSLVVAGVVFLPSLIVGAGVFLVVLFLAAAVTLAVSGNPVDVSPLWYWIAEQGGQAPDPWQLGLAWVTATLAAGLMPTSRWARTGLNRLFDWVAPNRLMRWVWGVLLAIGLTLLVSV